MRRLLPLALVLVACAKRESAAPSAMSAPKPPVETASLTPESMAKAMDVPLYPGAEAPDGLSSAPKRRDDGSTHYSLVLATKDPVDKVVAWYSKETRMPAMPGMVGKNLIGKSPKGNDLILTVAPEAGRTLVRIKSIAYAK